MADNSLGAKTGVPVVLPNISTNPFSVTFPVPANLGAGSIGSQSSQIKQNVADFQGKTRITKDTTAGSGTVGVVFTLPAGYTIATTLLTTSNVIGTAAFAGATFGSHMDVVALTSTTFAIRKNGAATNLTGADFTASSEVNIIWNFPCVEFALTAYTAYGAGIATSVKSGLVAPRKGTYNMTVTGSVALTGYTARGLYYQDQDGNHRLKFNITSSVAAGTRSANVLTVTGVTFKSGTNHFQPVAAFCNAAVASAYVNQAASTITIDHASGSSTLYGVSGDVELDSKPTWA